MKLSIQFGLALWAVLNLVDLLYTIFWAGLVWEVNPFILKSSPEALALWKLIGLNVTLGLMYILSKLKLAEFQPTLMGLNSGLFIMLVYMFLIKSGL